LVCVTPEHPGEGSYLSFFMPSRHLLRREVHAWCRSGAVAKESMENGEIIDLNTPICG